jgi:hypothetical protein
MISHKLSPVQNECCVGGCDVSKVESCSGNGLSFDIFCPEGGIMTGGFFERQ